MLSEEIYNNWLIYTEDTKLCLEAHVYNIANYNSQEDLKQSYKIDNDDSFTDNDSLLSQVGSNNEILLTKERYRA